MGSQYRHDGADGGWIRQRFIDATEIGLVVDEDTVRDSERNHTPEAAGILAFSQAFTCAATQDVVVTITGTNDAPDITVGAGESAAESLTETDAGLSVSDTLSVEDVDTSDEVDATVVSVGVVGDDDGIGNPALLAMMNVDVDALPAIDGSSTTGTIDWTFDSGTEAFDHLADGESLVLTYTISATDDSGVVASNSDTQTVVITINGTNDQPDITVDCSLLDDHFDDGNIGTAINGVNGGFHLVSNGAGGPGAISESGSNAVEMTTGGNNNTGIVSDNAIDVAGAAPNGIRMTFVVTDISRDPGSNGMFLGLQNDSSTFYRSGGVGHNFGLVFSGDEGRTSSAGGFGLVTNDIGNPGSAGNGTIFDDDDLQLSSLRGWVYGGHHRRFDGLVVRD